MLTNFWNTSKVYLFGQSTEQPLNHFELWKSWNTRKFEGWGLALVAYKKCIGDVKHRLKEKIKKSFQNL